MYILFILDITCLTYSTETSLVKLLLSTLSACYKLAKSNTYSSGMTKSIHIINSL